MSVNGHESKPPLSAAPSEPPPTAWEYITGPELARRLGIPPKWPAEHIRSRCADPIPCVRFGKFARFAWGSPALNAWIARRFSTLNFPTR